MFAKIMEQNFLKWMLGLTVGLLIYGNAHAQILLPPSTLVTLASCNCRVGGWTPSVWIMEIGDGLCQPFKCSAEISCLEFTFGQLDASGIDYVFASPFDSSIRYVPNRDDIAWNGVLVPHNKPFPCETD